MPIERLRMRPWLENALNEHKFPGVEWVDRDAKTFRIPWKHASRNGWQINTDACLFRAWAEHTGKYKSNQKPNAKTWKANFRCALNSLPDMEEMTEKRTTKGNNAFKMYRIINNVSKKGYHSKKMKGRAQKKKRQYNRSRNDLKESQLKKNSLELNTIGQSYQSGDLTTKYPCKVPQVFNGTHLVDHDYAVTRYFDIYDATGDESMEGVFDGVPDNVMVKTEPSSPKEMRTEEEFSLYEESALDSKNIKTSCTNEDKKIMSDDEVVELLDEMSSDSSSNGSDCMDTMGEEDLPYLDACLPLLESDFSMEKSKQRADSAPGQLESLVPLTIYCPLPPKVAKIERSKSTTDIQSMLSITPQEFLQSCL